MGLGVTGGVNAANGAADGTFRAASKGAAT
jgi:hypothetical protein